MLPKQPATLNLAFAFPSSQINVCVAGMVVWAYASDRAGIKVTDDHRDDQRRPEELGLKHV